MDILDNSEISHDGDIVSVKTTFTVPTEEVKLMIRTPTRNSFILFHFWCGRSEPTLRDRGLVGIFVAEQPNYSGVRGAQNFPIKLSRRPTFRGVLASHVKSALGGHFMHRQP